MKEKSRSKIVLSTYTYTPCQKNWPLKKKLLFGCPLSIGLKRRTEKKLIRRLWRNNFLNEESYQSWLKEMMQIKIGDIVNGCSGLNEKIISVDPDYCHVGKNSFVLEDVLLFMESGTSCSARNCGITVPLSFEHCEQYLENARKDPEWGEGYQKIKLNPDGTYVKEQNDERKRYY